MKKLLRSHVFRYGLAIVIVAATLILELLIRRVFTLNPTILILVAVILSAWYGGLGPGIMSAVLWSFLARLFVGESQPFFPLRLYPSDLPRLIILTLIALLAGWLRRASDARKTRALQQAAIARLGQLALEGTRLPDLMTETTRLVTETLDVRHCSILEYMAEEDSFLVLSGTGWKESPDGKRIIAAKDSMVGYTLQSGESMIANNLAKETRFRVHPDLIEYRIRSSMVVIIRGSKRPFGVLGAHALRKGFFTKDDINFLQSVANVLSAAIERKRAEEDLQNQQKWLENVLDLMPTPMLLVEPHTAIVTFANRGADEMAGGEFPKGKPAEEYHTVYYCTDEKGNRIPDEEMPGVRASRGERLEGFEMDWHTPAGKKSLILFSENVPAMHGHPSSAIIMFQDITNLKQIEAELQQANRLKDEFLATVSHELRTPLNAILGWAKMLRTSRLSADVSSRALETIERNARAQAQIIEDILDVSRIITGKLRLDVQTVEISSVIEDAVEAIRPASDAKAIRLQTMLDSEAGPVLGDPDRLQQVMWNLLSNAVKFTPKGGRIQISLKSVNSHIEITVSDTGEGINPDFLPYVFDRFRQADSTLTRSHGGLGLGLAIVRHLVELHGGTVSVYSGGRGTGATFKVELPVSITRDMSSIRIGAERVSKAIGHRGFALTPPASLDGLSILIVDDDADARDLLTTMLGELGASVTTASSAAEAVSALQVVKPDILVSDIEMPEEDGYSLIRRIRAGEVETNGWFPAIALTAHARTEDRLLALSAGFQSHVVKPVEPAELAAVISSLTRRTGRQD